MKIFRKSTKIKNVHIQRLCNKCDKFLDLQVRSKNNLKLWLVKKMTHVFSRLRTANNLKDLTGCVVNTYS